jgi:hypothetical protein
MYFAWSRIIVYVLEDVQRACTPLEFCQYLYGQYKPFGMFVRSFPEVASLGDSGQATETLRLHSLRECGRGSFSLLFFAFYVAARYLKKTFLEINLIWPTVT